MAKHKQDSKKEIAQVGRFGLVGILNTVVDFVVLNLLLRLVISRDTVYLDLFNNPIRGVIIAGIISGTIAMINSYIFNQRFTFKAKNVSSNRVVLFFVITAFGLYVIRPLVLKFFTEIWLWPADFAYLIGGWIGLPFDLAFYLDNVALAAAIVIVMAYNYLMYKKFVFVE